VLAIAEVVDAGVVAARCGECSAGETPEQADAQISKGGTEQDRKRRRKVTDAFPYTPFATPAHTGIVLGALEFGGSAIDWSSKELDRVSAS
jgi:hypothetical protein